MRAWILAAGMTGALATPAPAESLLKEGFDDGKRDGWHLTSGGEATVADDPKLGSGNALFLATHAGSSQRRILANFKPVELAKAGDAIVLRFDYRIVGSADAVRGTGDADGGFRFGLFDSGGTLQTADAAGGSSGEAGDDVGYLAMTSVGVRNRARLVEEKAEDPYFMGGTDLTFLKTDDAFGGITDALEHSAVFTIRRLSSTAIGLELVVDGKASIRAEVADGLRTRFDEVGFAASHRAADFAIDNIEVTSGPLPASTSSASGVPTVRARCEPCTIEIGKETTMTAEVRASGGRPLTYKWSASTGKFADPTARQTSWTAPLRKGWSEERWKGGGGVPITVTVGDGGGRTASDTVTVDVTRLAAR